VGNGKLGAWWRKVWPTQDREETVNPESLFESYGQATGQIESHFLQQPDATLLLASARQMFKDEDERRNSIDNRASSVIGAVGITGTIVVGLGAGLLTDLAATNVVAFWIVIPTYLLALLYLARAVIAAIQVHGPAVRYILGPDELQPESGTTEPGYQVQQAMTLIRFTIENYKADNKVVEVLAVAQACFRNAIVVVIFAGALAPILAVLFRPAQ
jgi:hypothetical protein